MLNNNDFAEAYERGLGRTTAFIRSRGLTPAKAEEIAQAAWVKGWERREQLRNDSAIVEWVNSIAFNMLRGAANRDSRFVQPVEGAEAGVIDQHVPDTSKILDLKTVLARCREQDRELLWALFAEGYTSQEIAKKLGVKPSTIRVRAFRAKQHLERFMGLSPEPLAA